VEDPYLKAVLEAIEAIKREGNTGRPHLISADELRAMGALDVPPAWRKSLSARLERDLFSDLVDDEEPHPDDQDPATSDEDDDEAVDDRP
jgi:hypothetical protein